MTKKMLRELAARRGLSYTDMLAQARASGWTSRTSEPFEVVYSFECYHPTLLDDGVAPAQRRAAVPVRPVQKRERREPVARSLPPLHRLHDEPRVFEPVEKLSLRPESPRRVCESSTAVPGPANRRLSLPTRATRQGARRTPRPRVTHVGVRLYASFRPGFDTPPAATHASAAARPPRRPTPTSRLHDPRRVDDRRSAAANPLARTFRAHMSTTMSSPSVHSTVAPMAPRPWTRGRARRPAPRRRLPPTSPRERGGAASIRLEGSSLLDPRPMRRPQGVGVERPRRAGRRHVPRQKLRAVPHRGSGADAAPFPPWSSVSVSPIDG